MYDFLSKNPTFPVIVISAIVAFFSYLTQKRLTKSKCSIDFQSAFHDSEAIQKSTLNIIFNIPNLNTEEIENLANQASKNSDLSADIKSVLNEWERVAIAIKKDIYDEDVLYLAYGTTIIFLWNKLRPYIKKRQSINPRLYVNFDWLAIKWIVKRGGNRPTKELNNIKKAQKLLSSI